MCERRHAARLSCVGRARCSACPGQCNAHHRLYIRIITRDVIIGGSSYEPGDVVRVSANTLRQLIEEFAVTPHEKMLRWVRPADQRRRPRRCRRRVV